MDTSPSEDPISSTEGLPSEWDNERLKRLVVALKKKYETAAAALTSQSEENQVLKGQQSLLRQMLEQSQREAENTRKEFEAIQQQIAKFPEGPATLEQVEEAQAELSRIQIALRNAQRDKEMAQELLNEEQQNANLYKARLEKLGQAIKERDKRIADLNQFEYSYRKACEHKLHLEAQLEQETNCRQVLAEREEKLKTTFATVDSKATKQQKLLQEAQERITTLDKQLSDLQKTAEGSKKQLEEQQHLVARVTEQMQQAVYLKSSATEELKAFQEQFKQLKNRTIAAQQELKVKESALLEAHQIIEQIKFDNQHLQRDVSDRNRYAEELRRQLIDIEASSGHWQQISAEQDIQLNSLRMQLKDALERVKEQEITLSDNREMLALLQNDIEDATGWRIAAEASLIGQQEAIDRLSREKEAISNDLQETSSEMQMRCDALTTQLQTALKTINALEAREGQYCATIEDRDSQYETLCRDFDHRGKVIESFEEALKDSEAQNQERENALKIAQHHLAKKVKDYSILEEKYGELQQTIYTSKKQFEELENTLEEQRQLIRQQEEQHLESKKLGEAHIREWERKYFDKDEAWQQSERRCQYEHSKLVEVERQLERCVQRLEKYIQLEMMLKNLGLGALQTTPEPPSLPADDTTVPPMQPLQQQHPLPILPTSSLPVRQESFFESSLMAPKRKDHLFD